MAVHFSKEHVMWRKCQYGGMFVVPKVTTPVWIILDSVSALRNASVMKIRSFT